MIRLASIAKPHLSEESRLITELFDFENVQEYKFKDMCFGGASRGEFKTDKGEKVEMFSTTFPFDMVEYNRDLPSSFNQDRDTMITDLAFVVDGKPGQARKASLQEFLPIIKTVFLWIRDSAIPCIEKNAKTSGDPNPIFQIAAQAKTDNFNLGDDKQKKLMYKYLINKHIPSGYQQAENRSDMFDKDVFLFQRK